MGAEIVMTFPKARLAVSACLLVAWLLYLGFLVYGTRDVVVLSKPQFMIAQLYVVVDVGAGAGADGPSEDVTVDKVLWSANPADQPLTGQILHLADLEQCGKENGYHGAGKYLVPLLKSPYRIAPVPRTLAEGAAPIAIIYPWTPETEAQAAPLIAAKK